jgi:hypothetical protein
VVVSGRARTRVLLYALAGAVAAIYSVGTARLLFPAGSFLCNHQPTRRRQKYYRHKSFIFHPFRGFANGL